MDNIQNHGNNKRLEKEKQKLRAAKTVYKDGIKTRRRTHNTTRRDAQHRNVNIRTKVKIQKL